MRDYNVIIIWDGITAIRSLQGRNPAVFRRRWRDGCFLSFLVVPRRGWVMERVGGERGEERISAFWAESVDQEKRRPQIYTRTMPSGKNYTDEKPLKKDLKKILT